MKSRECSKHTKACSLISGYAEDSVLTAVLVVISDIGYVVAVNICTRADRRTLASGNVVYNMLGIGNFINRSCKRVKGDDLRCGSILRNGAVIAADNHGLRTTHAVCKSILGLLGNAAVKLGNTAIGLIHCLCGRFNVNIFSCKRICSILCGICKQGLGGSVLKHTLSCSLRGLGSIVTVCGRRGNVSKAGVIYTAGSTAKLVKILLKEISVFSKKSCDIIIYTLTGDIAYIAFIVDIIVCVIYVIGGRLAGGGLAYSSSFFRRSYGLLRLLLSSLLFLGLCCGSCGSGSRCGSG